MTTGRRKFSLSQIVLSSLLTLAFFPAVTLVLGGNWKWIQGWILSLWFSAMVFSITVYTYLKDPALLAERAQLPGSQNQKAWDKYLLAAIYVIAIAWLVIMPLDAGRFGWSPPFPVWLEACGALLLIPALYLIVQATVQNTFPSALVRIQSDRGQRVISTGVYALVRHPLYLGCLLMMIGAPSLLGSVCGLLLTLVGFGALVGRILGEEKMLAGELKGYQDYQKRARYRLIPLIW